MNYEYRPVRITDYELVEAFPEGKVVVLRNIKILQQEIYEREMEIEKILTQLYSLKLESFSEWFWEKVIEELVYSEVENYKKQLRKLKNIYFLYRPNTNVVNNFEEKLDRARNYPILEIASNNLDLKKTGKSYVSLCPFHQEKTPSCHIYPESNRFKCYGCGETGDVIKLTQYLCGVDFKNAVGMLQ